MAAAASDPFAWDFSPPRSPALGDHEVPQLSRQLAGRHIALMVCGGIAAFKVPLLARALRRHGAEVTAFCSEEALRYVGAEALAWATCRPLVTTLSWRAEHLSDAEGQAGEAGPEAGSQAKGGGGHGSGGWKTADHWGWREI